MELENKEKIPFPLRSFSASVLLTLATSASAAPGTLSDVPLYIRSSAEPNIMFVLDSSTSMKEMVWPPGDYDSSATYASCSGGIADGPGENYRVHFRVNRANGSVEFLVVNTYDNDERVGDWRTWDTSGNCFDEEDTFGAWFYANDEDSTYFYTGTGNDYYLRRGDILATRVSGHLLNWYFSERNASGVYEAAKFLGENGVRRSKVDIRRTDIVNSAASELIYNLADARVGLMQFDGGSSARALVGLSSLTDASRGELLDKIAGMTLSSGTPLAESFSAVGRYFISGYESQQLTYFGQDENTLVAAGSDIFDSPPEWNDVTPSVPVPDNTVAGGAIQYYCQKSFMVALTDGEPTSDDDISDHLKGFDYACDDSPGGCTNDSQGYNDEDGRRYHEMDDVIKALYDIDLRPDLSKPDGTPVKNNIITHIIGFAEEGLSDTPMMINAGALGGGELYAARDANELRTSFNQIANSVYATVGSSSSVAFNSSSLEAGSAIFTAGFNSGDWSGEFSALSIDDNGQISDSPSWEAGSLLDSADADRRVMLTYRKGAGGVAFTWGGLGLGEGGGAHAQDLNINTSTGSIVIDERASDRIRYLRGYRSYEGTESDEFRERSSRLGDIINSSPVYVGAPNAAWPDSAPFPTGESSYSAFKSDQSSRTPVVYVGANDGFLHGFNANTSGADAGKELIAFSPSALLSTDYEPGLHALTSQNYRHKFYVDGALTVSDAFISGSWRTALVGGLSGGGKGYYALDVTDPGSFSEANASSLVLWEFTDADNNNLGYSYSRPQIGLMSNGEWAAIFGNGYNSETGDAGLFIVYLDGDGGAGSRYTYISTGTSDVIDKNGLSTPAIVDSDRDGIIDRIYAGDLKGNLWAFDVSTTGSWGVAGGSQPLFTTGESEPVTAAPLVLRNNANRGGSDPNLLVTFGTGQYLSSADTANNTAGGFYAVSDSGSYGLEKEDLVVRNIATSNITQADGTTIGYRTLNGSAIDWDTEYGWYIRLNSGSTPAGEDAGERVVSRPDLLRNVLFFNTLIPTGQVCSAGGYGWLMSVDVSTGLAPAKFAVFDGTGDGKIDSADQGLVGQFVNEGVPNKSGFLGGKKQYIPTSAGTIISRDINVGSAERDGRLSWEEVTPF